MPNNKVNPKKTINRPSWKLEGNNIARQKLGAWGCGSGKGKGKERRKKGKTGETLGEWGGRDGGRTDIGAGKKISILREPF